MKKLTILLMGLIATWLLVGCGYDVVQDGTTGIVVRDGAVSDEYLSPGRYSHGFGNRRKVIHVDNRIIDYEYSGPSLEAQSSDGVIVYADSYTFTFRIGRGEKSVWLVRNREFEEGGEKALFPADVAGDALKDAIATLPADKATYRKFVQPIFKEILQERIDEKFGYSNGEDTSLVIINSVTVGNLHYDPEYDKEVSRTQLLEKKAANDARELELTLQQDQRRAEADIARAQEQAKADLEKAKADLESVNANAAVEQAKAQNAVEIARLKAEEEAAELEALSKYLTPEQILEYKQIEAVGAKWDGKFYQNSPANALLEAFGKSNKSEE